MEEMTDLEQKARSFVTQLQSANPKFDLTELLQFASEHGWQACQAVMEGCLEYNSGLTEKNVPTKQLGALFRQRSRQYGGQEEQEQKATEWEGHKQALIDDDKKMGYVELKAMMDKQLKGGYISHQQHEDSMDFLDKVEQERKVREDMAEHKGAEKHFPCLLWNDDKSRMECRCGEPVSSMKLHATVSIALTWVDADDSVERFGCDEWEYRHVFLKCVCGVIISTDSPESLTGKDFTFSSNEDYWEVIVPKAEATKAARKDNHE